MDTKTAKGTYSQYMDLSFLEDDKPKMPTQTGLLTPTRISDKMSNNNNIEQPAYRVAKYIAKIRSMNPKKNTVA